MVAHLPCRLPARMPPISCCTIAEVAPAISGFIPPSSATTLPEDKGYEYHERRGG